MPATSPAAAADANAATVDPWSLMAPGYVPRPDEPLMSWARIFDIVTAGSLGDLDRQQSCQREYDQWAAWVRAHGVSLEQLLRLRLGWPAEQTPPAPTAPHNGTGPSDTHLLVPPPSAPNVLPGTPPVCPSPSVVAADAALAGQGAPPDKPPFMVHTSSGITTKMVPNDWPYAVPDGAQHWVIWADVPIVHPALFAESPINPGDEVPYPPTPEVARVLHQDRSSAYAAVGSDGVRGLSGWEHPSPDTPAHDRQVVGIATLAYAQSVVNTNQKYASLAAEDREPAARSLANQLQAWAGRHIQAMVHAKFPPEEYQCAWFCNPPHLRTVPGLSHFQYVMAP